MRHVLVGGGYLAGNLIKYLEKIASKDEIKIIGIDENIFFDIPNLKTFPNLKKFSQTRSYISLRPFPVKN